MEVDGGKWAYMSMMYRYAQVAVVYARGAKFGVMLLRGRGGNSRMLCCRAAATVGMWCLANILFEYDV